jgi:organic radical activating enzyme
MQKDDLEYIDYLNNKTKFCILPFTHTDYTNNGAWRPCCKGNAIATNKKYKTLEEYWNSTERNQLRKMMIDNESFYVCENSCYKNEKPDIADSLRKTDNINFIKKYGRKKIEKIIADTNTDGSLDISNNTGLELRISNLCNLKCRMCTPKFSTRIAKDWKEVLPVLKKHMSNIENESSPNYEKNWREYLDNPLRRVEFLEIIAMLETTKGNLKRLVFTGGEPFMEPYLLDTIKYISDYGKDIELIFVSNGTKFEKLEDFDYYFRKFKKVIIKLSCDGTKNHYNYIRQNSDWEHFSQEALYLKNFKVVIDFNIVVQIYNYQNVLETVEWILDNFKYTDINLTFLDLPNFMSVYCLPYEIKEKFKNDLTIWSEEFLNKNNKLNDNQKKIVYDKVIKLSNQIFFKNNQYLLKTFIAVSDKFDEVQKVPIKWRELLPELSEALK